MKKSRRTRLERGGWKIGSTEEFLGLTREEAAYVEIKLALSDALHERRTKGGLTQADLAERLGSSQSRVAKMEAADPTVSVDLLLRGLFASGASREEVGAAIGGRTPRRKHAGKSRRVAARGRPTSTPNSNTYRKSQHDVDFDGQLFDL